MAFGAIRHSHAQVGVAVTGIAGPTGGSEDKPVGTVWFGFSVDGRLHSEMRRFDGDRAAVRQATVQHALAAAAGAGASRLGDEAGPRTHAQRLQPLAHAQHRAVLAQQRAALRAPPGR